MRERSEQGRDKTKKEVALGLFFNTQTFVYYTKLYVLKRVCGSEKGAHKEKRRRAGSEFFLLVEMAPIAHFRRVKGIGGMGKAKLDGSVHTRLPYVLQMTVQKEPKNRKRLFQKTEEALPESGRGSSRIRKTAFWSQSP